MTNADVVREVLAGVLKELPVELERWRLREKSYPAILRKADSRPRSCLGVGVRFLRFLDFCKPLSEIEAEASKIAKDIADHEAAILGLESGEVGSALELIRRKIVSASTSGGGSVLTAINPGMGAAMDSGVTALRAMKRLLSKPCETANRDTVRAYLREADPLTAALTRPEP
ncbi:MAG: hypothetical protein HW405_431 [Candidatus Berkelbacteria bacterium]|nr:hypothetical protein [Candidatus Berkelbacteria bacterium]